MRAFYRKLKEKLPVTNDAWYVVVGMVMAAVMVLFLLAFVTIAQQNDIQDTIREIRTETEVRYEQDRATQTLLCNLVKEQRAELSEQLLRQAEQLPNCDIFDTDGPPQTEPDGSPIIDERTERAITGDDNEASGPRTTPTPDDGQPNPKPDTPGPTPTAPGPNTPGPSNPAPNPTVTNPTPTNPKPTNPTPTPVKPGPVVGGEVSVGPVVDAEIIIDPTPLVDPIIETVDPIIAPVIAPVKPALPTVATPQIDVCPQVSGLQLQGTVCLSVGSVSIL